MKNRYRIVTDRFAGYEVQVKFWWFPIIWFQLNEVGGVNTFHSKEAAQEWLFKYLNGNKWRSKKVWEMKE